MSTARVKFTCTKKDGNTVVLHAVSSNDLQSLESRMALVSPFGEMKITPDNPLAPFKFEKGKTYIVDITPVD